LNIQILGLLIAKIASNLLSNQAQTDDNVETLARFTTTFGVVLASAPSIQAGAGLFFANTWRNCLP